MIGGSKNGKQCISTPYNCITKRMYLMKMLFSQYSKQRKNSSFSLSFIHMRQKKVEKLFFLFYIHRIVNVRITCLQLPPSFHKKSLFIFVYPLYEKNVNRQQYIFFMEQRKYQISSQCNIELVKKRFLLLLLLILLLQLHFT